MRAEAREAGHRFSDRLADEWNTGRVRFDRPGEALFAAYVGGTLAGIGGVTIDPVLAGAVRMRRFYVRQRSRRQGVGRALAVRVIAISRCAVVVVNAGTPEAAPFWEMLGFVADISGGHTHRLSRRGDPKPQCGR